MLFAPMFESPPDRMILPPLTARLEPLPKPIAQPAAKPESATPVASPDDDASVEQAAEAMDAMAKTEEPTATRPLPKHIRLTFDVYKGADGFKTGEIRHRLDIHGNRYTLQAVKNTAGLTRLLDIDQLIQTSRGKIVEHGLHPETFSMETITAGGKHNLKASFDWVAQKLHFSDGGETALPVGAQDILSFRYQISQLPMHGEFFTLPVSDVAQLEQYEIEIGGVEDITTPMGNLRALHLRKMHSQRQAYFEIWLGQEYRLLPVKFRQVDSSNEVTEEIVVSDIRAADE
jgi:hypothetical protein